MKHIFWFPFLNSFFVSREPRAKLMANGEREELNYHWDGHFCSYITGLLNSQHLLLLEIS